jgi:hypothetical protein
VRDAIELATNSRINVWVVVPVNVCPDGGIPIDVFATPAVTQHRSVPFDQNQWLMLRGTPFRHVSKRVPDELLVPSNQLVCVPLNHEASLPVELRHFKTTP